jgi:large subunit ribosomal protein L1
MAGKKYTASAAKVEAERRYSLEDALKLMDGFEKAKFDEMVDMAIRLGVDPKQTDQQVRGACTLPHGIGKKVRVAVFAKGEKQREATEAGADAVGAEDLAEKISGGWMEFDATVSTPDMMGVVGKLGKVLGPRGLMPNPKLGTVTFDLAKAVREVKAGKVEFRCDKAGVVHVPVGKRSFGPEKLKDNIMALLEVLIKARPASVKGNFIRSMSVSATMSPGIRLDVTKYQKTV